MVYKKGEHRTKESIEKSRKGLIEYWKKKHANDKTDAAATITATSPPVLAPQEAAPVFKSSVLTEINVNKEFDKMAQKLNKKEEKKDTKEMKYECSSCGHQFNHFAEGKTCPGCGEELDV